MPEHCNVEVRDHHRQEERLVFTALAAGGDTELADTLARLRQDHHWIEQDGVELAPHLDAIGNGQSWYSLDILREGGGIFTALCQGHIALEESVIYPQAPACPSREQLQAMRNDMADRRPARRPMLAG